MAGIDPPTRLYLSADFYFVKMDSLERKNMHYVLHPRQFQYDRKKAARSINWSYHFFRLTVIKGIAAPRREFTLQFRDRMIRYGTCSLIYAVVLNA